MEEELQEALNDLRLMIDSLDSVGNSLDMLLAIFHERAKRRLKPHGIRLVWNNRLEDPAEGFGPRDILNIFRILQEALTNIQKHAQATEVTISIREDKATDALLITVQDNGRGMSDDADAPKGRGLLSMRQRAARLGGQLRIDSRDQGTSLILKLPSRQETNTIGDGSFA